MKKILYILILQILFSNDFENIGLFTETSNSYDFISMSGSTTSWISGVSSIGSNPAGLSKLKGIGVELGMSVESANIYNNDAAQFPFFSIGYGLKNEVFKGTELYAAIGISYQSRTTNNIEGWDSNENFEGLFNFTESAMTIALAVDLQPVSFGFKWVNYSQDFGQYGSQNSNDFFKPIGFGIQYSLSQKINFGIEISKVSEVGLYDYTIGKSKAGVSYLLNEFNLIAVDYEKLSNNNGSLSLGYQMHLFDSIQINTGLKNIVTEDGNYNHISLGLSSQTMDRMNFNLAMKQNVGSDIASPLSRILFLSISYDFK